MTVLGIDQVGEAHEIRRVDGLVGESGPHVANTPPQSMRVHVRKGVDQGALYLVEHLRRHDRLEDASIEGGEQEIAGDNRDQEVGVDDGNADWHQS